MSKRFSIVLAFTLAAPLLSAGEQEKSLEPSRDAIEFFEKKIRPVLADRCYKCHSAQSAKVKGGLRLDTREGILKGGESGPAVVPGDPDRSLLIKAIRHADDQLQMPAKEKLPEEQIADFVAWVKMGAPDPRRPGAGPASPAPELDLSVARQFWSFRPPHDAPPPEFKEKTPSTSLGTSWPKTPIDQFILARLEEKGLKPSPQADRRTLLRRATYDLTGLPPTPEEIDAFLADASTNAFEKVVDRLLASPRYGERWGRHWLDVARYADTKEWVVDEERRLAYAYTYRDWVIRAFNEDLPYDQMILQQLAADRLPSASDKRTLAALGFLTVGRSFLNRLPDIIDDRIDVVSRGLLGLTASCARCHDHKYDPIPTRDYYSLYGIFASAAAPKELPLLGEPVRNGEYVAFEKELKAKEGEVTKFRESKYAAIAGGLRTAPQIAEYLLAGQEARGMADEDLRALAQKRTLNRTVLRRWADFLRKTAEGRHPVFAPWHALAALPAAEFAEKAQLLLAEIRDVNPLVREALAEPPASLRDAADRYGSLLANFDRAEPLADRDQEALRLVLRAPDAAPNMPLAEVDQLLSQDDRGKLRKLKRAVDELHNHPGAPPRAMALEDLPAPFAPHVFIRGNAGTPGEEVPRHFLAILCSDKREAYKDGGRLQLATAIASRENPLTARVLVNRVWGHHFGRGIVATPSDFGTRGERPTHPELLDWLARKFMDDGASTPLGMNWSIKKLHRLILLSAVYQQSSLTNAEGQRADPQNLLLWRMNRLRLEFEALRDSVLAVSGQLDLAIGGRSVEIAKEPFSRRRTVYGHVDRLNLANMFRVFDFAGPDMHAPQRYTTTVPQQALFMMNSPFVQEQAQALVRRAEFSGESDPEQRLQRLYRQVYGRAATAKEALLGLEFVNQAGSSPGEGLPSALTPWEKYAQVLLEANEFTFVD